MKVLLINGSPNEKGSTYTALLEAAETLKNEGLEAEIYWIGNKPISGCIACRKCKEKGNCVINDKVNEFRVLAQSADGFVFGTPVHYAAASGALTSFMDRVFYSEACGNKNKAFYLKPAAAVVCARRGGNTAAFDQINKYFTIQQMPIISSTYWNMVYGARPEDILQDAEGLKTMRVLAKNMAFFLKCKEAGLKAGIALPKAEPPVFTNFIR